MYRDNWEIVLNHSCQLGEGPVWDAENECVLWVDIPAGQIHSFYPHNREHFVFETGQMVGSIAIRSSGILIAALQHGFHEISLEKRTVKQLTDPEAHLPGNRFNDGKCDLAGRFWAGTMSVSDEPGAGKLYMLDKDQTVSVKIENVSCSNGLAWSPDHNIFYYIDTPTQQVVAYDYDLTTGGIRNKRVVIEICQEEGFPDGMTIDEEGMLWIALWDGWKVARYNPYNGELLHQIHLPVARITSCTFGGSNLQDLYITSAKTGLKQEELAQQPLAGCLFVIKNIGVSGR
jgi:sugar lactone lactonase YvrE